MELAKFRPFVCHESLAVILYSKQRLYYREPKSIVVVVGAHEIKITLRHAQMVKACHCRFYATIVNFYNMYYYYY